jgi:hypothetical protein
MTLEELIQAYCHASTPREGGYTQQLGFTMDDLTAFQHHVPADCVEIEEWRDQRYRAVWVNDPKRTVITYCEGDIIISQFPAFEAYYTYLVEVAQVYRTH